MSQTSHLEGRSLLAFRKRLLRWYRESRRELPWRARPPQGANRSQRTRVDPYRVWISEIMLQQTRIAAVLPYYERFLARFPDVKALATARQDSVLKLWSGLGYYSRARNFHRAAKQIVARHDGQFPRELDGALALPGIGSYTAAAILSIAYDVPLAVLDGNVARVLARLFVIRGDLRADGRWQMLGEKAQKLLAANAAGDWNQAVMELGETICTPRSPQCGRCPIARWCRAHALGLTDKIPSARRKRTPVHIEIAAAVLLDPQGRTLLVRDPGAHDDVLFSRMWQFPAVAVTSDAEAELAAHLHATAGLNCTNGTRLQRLQTARHGVTFRNITLLPFLARVEVLPRLSRSRIIALGSIAELQISNATRKIAAAASRAAIPAIMAS